MNDNPSTHFDAANTPEDVIPTQIDCYVISRLLGEGGMGQVYLARKEKSDKPVAIKVLKPSLKNQSAMRADFIREAKYMQRINHPNVMPIVELVEESLQGPYYVLPYVEGGSLADQLMDGKPLLQDKVIEIALQTAEALRHAHDEHGMIHRDLKPQNILVSSSGRVRLADFGLARSLFNETEVDPKKKPNWTTGTRPYMPPEVVAGKASDTRADIYSFGAMLYEMCTGLKPYNGQTTEEVMIKIKLGPPAPIREVNPAITPELATVIEGSMARELRDRYASMSDVLEDLRLIRSGKKPTAAKSPASISNSQSKSDRQTPPVKLSEPVSTIKQSNEPNSQTPRKRSTWPMTILFLLLIASIAGGVYYLVVSDLMSSIKSPPSKSAIKPLPNESEGRGSENVDYPKNLIPSNATADEVSTLLSASLRNGDDAISIEAIDWLMDDDTRSAVSDRFHQHEAIIFNRMAVISHLIKKQIKLNARDAEGNLPLHTAAKHNKSAIIDLLVKDAEVGFDVRSSLTDETPLHVAAKFGRLRAMEHLIKLGADVNAKNMGAATPLHQAIMAGQLEAVTTLIKAHADLTIPYKKQSPIELANEYGQKEISRTIANAD